MSKINKKFLKKIKLTKKEKGVYLILLNPELYKETNNALLQELLGKRKLSGIYLSLNRRCSDIVSELKSKKINTSKLYLIDAVSEVTGKNSGTNCVFVSRKQSLTEISLAITKAVNTKNFDFLHLDSINTLLVYNDSKTVAKFIHFLVSKLKNSGLSATLLTIQDEDEAKKLIPFISQICEACIKVYK